MPNLYIPVELSDEQREVLSSATAIVACESLPTQQAITEFSGLPSRKVSAALKFLKSVGLVTIRRVK